MRGADHVPRPRKDFVIGPALTRSNRGSRLLEAALGRTLGIGEEADVGEADPGKPLDVGITGRLGDEPGLLVDLLGAAEVRPVEKHVAKPSEKRAAADVIVAAELERPLEQPGGGGHVLP